VTHAYNDPVLLNEHKVNVHLDFNIRNLKQVSIVVKKCGWVKIPNWGQKASLCYKNMEQISLFVSVQ